VPDRVQTMPLPKPSDIEDDEEEIEEEEEEEEEIEEIEDDDDNNNNNDDDDDSNRFIVVDGHDKSPLNQGRSSSSGSHHLRCRQCDYDADDLSDLLVHRKGHASMKYNATIDPLAKARLVRSSTNTIDKHHEVRLSIEKNQTQSHHTFYELFDCFSSTINLPMNTSSPTVHSHVRMRDIHSFIVLELLWLENNPRIKQYTTSRQTSFLVLNLFIRR
jgi:hypothetical protein